MTDNKTAIQEQAEKPLSIFIKGLVIGVVVLITGVVIYIAAFVLPVALTLSGWE